MNSSSEKTDFTFKILTIGESNVGKTCLLLRYTDNKFVKNHLTTIGIDFRAKVINYNGKSVKLKVWDTAGQERFRNITQQYYKSADGIVLVYDVTDRESFEKVNNWIKQINMYTQTDKIGIVLLGNKIDIAARDVTSEEGIEMAQTYGIKHFETSVLNNINVEESFKFLTEEIMKKKNIDLSKEVVRSSGASGIALDKPVNSQGKKKGCC